MGIIEVSRALHITKSQASTTVQKLVLRALATRTDTEVDRRCCAVAPSEEGWRLIQHLFLA